VVVGAALAVSGCAARAQSTKSTNMCTQYSELANVASQFTTQELTGATAEDLRFRDHGLQTQLDALAAASDGRLDAEIATLQSSLDDYAAAVQVSAGARTASAPLIEKSVKDVQNSWAELRDAAATECGPTPQT
jgi:hypothetical protein